MILDTSSIVAILKLEERYEAVAQAIAHAPVRRMSTATLLETWVVILRLHDPFVIEELEKLLAEIDPIFEPVSAVQVGIAQRAYQTYGRGMEHPARLNFGDCFAYALAIDLDEPLLFVGNDFSQTNVTAALPPQ